MSLMGQIAAARQTRLQQNVRMLEAAKHRRLAQHQALTARLKTAQEVRQQRVAGIAAGVHQFLADRQQHQHHLQQECQLRLQQVAQAAQQVRQQLTQMQQDRATQQALELDSRQQLAAQRSEAVQNWLNTLTTTRRAEAETMRQELTAFSTSLSETVSAFLSSTTHLRQAMGELQKDTLASFATNLASSVDTLLHGVHAERQAMGQAQQDQLAAFCQTLRLEVQALQQEAVDFVQETAAHRQVSAEALRQSLSNFAHELRTTVWGDGLGPMTTPSEPIATNGKATGIASDLLDQIHAPQPVAPAEPQPDWIAAPTVEPIAEGAMPEPMLAEAQPTLLQPAWIEPVSPAAPMEPSGEHAPSTAAFESVETAVAEPAIDPESILESLPVSEAGWHEPSTSSDPDPQVRIMDFVGTYIEDLQATSPELTVLQIIGNRELVRDLLGKGAATLGVDPSELLSVLRRMVSNATPVTV